MYKHIIICNILLLITFIKGSTVPAPKVSDNTDEKLVQPQSSVTKQGISEGGLVASNPITLRNKTFTELLNVENDLVMNKEKPIQPRKGVDNNSTEDVNQQDKIELSLPAANNTNLKSTTVKLLQLNATQNIKLNNTQQLNKTEVHKPLILSHEALEKIDKANNVDINENGPDIKVHAMKANSHPGMIMPIVITILVVPMFAVVGYMALKRGREAWKNRHYKRMDFLLDGMYND